MLQYVTDQRKQRQREPPPYLPSCARPQATAPQSECQHQLPPGQSPHALTETRTQGEWHQRHTPSKTKQNKTKQKHFTHLLHEHNTFSSFLFCSFLLSLMYFTFIANHPC
jgi:hypothetical protein